MKTSTLYLTNNEYAQLRREQIKLKKLNQQLKNNQKSQRGFGYTYTEIDYQELVIGE